MSATGHGTRTTQGGDVDDLIVFLEARLDEDVLVAIAAPRGPWSWDAPNGYPQQVTNPRAVVVAETYCSPDASGCVADHIVRHDPDRVLREVEAKRQIIEHSARLHQMADPATHPGQEYVLAAGASDRVLRILALPYADHSDYRKEWRP